MAPTVTLNISQSFPSRLCCSEAHDTIWTFSCQLPLSQVQIRRNDTVVTRTCCPASLSCDAFIFLQNVCSTSPRLIHTHIQQKKRWQDMQDRFNIFYLQQRRYTEWVAFEDKNMTPPHQQAPVSKIMRDWVLNTVVGNQPQSQANNNNKKKTRPVNWIQLTL